MNLMAAKNTNRNKKGSGNARSKPFFEDHWPLELVRQGLASGQLIEGTIRVNPKNFEESFILHPSGDADVLIKGVKARNRALTDDVVAIQIQPIRQWILSESNEIGPPGDNRKKNSKHVTVEELLAKNPTALAGLFPGAAQPVDLNAWKDPPGCSDLFRTVVRTAKVVAVLRSLNHRQAVGTVRLMVPKPENPLEKMLFCPLDHRFPRMVLEKGSYPPELFLRPEDFTSSYLVGRMLDWPNTGVYALGKIERLLGEAGDLTTEQEALLVNHGVTQIDFPPETLAELPSATPDESTWGDRRDLRDRCVFSIDPPTARDLDDALHILPLGPSEDFGYEVGVHIADVSFYVPEMGKLDAEARRRATTVYLVERAIPMLPSALSERLCSLTPGEPKLCFSVVWQMDKEGRPVDTWFGRTVVQSCTQLSYAHAQAMIDNKDEGVMPHIHEPWALHDVRRCVQQLWSVAKAKRALRFEQGALRLNSAKLGFVLDQESGLPCGFLREELQESNALVEELMVAANIAVAEKLYSVLPEEAFLRRHPAPSVRALEEVKTIARVLGTPIQTDSASDIQNSLTSLEASTGPEVLEVLVNFLSKPMQLAQYFCCGQLARCDKAEQLAFTHHYALNVPLYTHFTSPIRRYPDIVVHRQLAAVLAGKASSIAEADAPSLDSTAAHCNWAKKNAKLAGESSRELYLRALISQLGEMEESGIVLGVLDRAFDVMLVKIGCVKRVYCDQIENLQDVQYSALARAKGAGRLRLLFKDGHRQEVRPMSRVPLLLRSSGKLKFDVLLVPKPRLCAHTDAGES